MKYIKRPLKMAVNNKMNATKRVFALFFIICYAHSIYTQAAVIKRREIETTESPETLEQMGNGSSNNSNIGIQHDNVTAAAAKSTKLMPQPVTSNETELPKKTTLKIVNGPMTTTTIATATGEIIPTTVTTQRNENFMSELKDRVSEKHLDLQINTNMNPTIPTTTAQPTENLANETMPTKNLSLTLNPVFIPESTTASSSTTEKLPSLPTTDSTAGLFAQKTMDLSFDDSDDIQNVSSSKVKQPKFLNDNSTNSNQLNLPNTAVAWTLVGMKNTPMPHNGDDDDDIMLGKQNTTTVDIKEKTLADFAQIVKMGVNNALTDDVESVTSLNDQIGETTENLIETSTRPANIRALYTTPHAEISNQQYEKEEFHDKLLNNQTLMTLTSTFLVASTTTETILSEQNDNTDMKTKTPIATTTTTIEPIKELIKEKIIINNKEKEELEVSTKLNSSSTTILNAMFTTTTTTTTTQTPLEEMSILNSNNSTPATAIVSSTTERNFEVRHEQNNNNQKQNNNTSSGITQAGEKDVIDVVVETTTKLIEENQIETTTIEPTIRPPPSIFLASNVTTEINNHLPSTTIATPTTTTTTTADIHQISEFKSNLETPTTTVKATIEIETKNILNSSAIANETESTTTPTTTTTTAVDGGVVLTNVTNVNAVSVNVDSLSAQSTTEFSSTAATITKPAVTTTTIKETAHVTTETTLLLEETTLNKDLTVVVSSSEKPQVLDKQEKNEIELNSTTTAPTTSTKAASPVIDESKNIFITSETPEIALEMTTSNILVNENESSTKFEINTTSTPEPPIIKFLDDSTTTTTTSTTTKSPIIAIESSTSISVTNKTTTETTAATTTTSTSTSTQTPTTLSVDLNETFPESTTPTTTTTKLPTTIIPQTTLNTFEVQTIATTEEDSLSTTTEMIPTTTPLTTTPSPHFDAAPSIPIPASTTLNPLVLHGAAGVLHPNHQPAKTSPDSPETDVNVVIAISVSVIGVVALILLVAFLYLMRKRQKQTTYGQRCRPVSLDAYSLDNVSVMGSMRKRPSRLSKRSYGNAAFQDPALRHNIIQTAADLAEFAKKRTTIFSEFDDVPKVTARAEEIPQGCEDKNRYANVIPLPETRVILQRRNDDDTTEYINANYVRGPSDAPNYYIACQAPLEATVQDFWRMIWEQQSRVIIQATDLFEEGKERCAEYIPPSVTLDNHTTYGDFQVTLKNREVKDKYAISTLLLKNTVDNTCREITHYWYKWPEQGVPAEEAPIIAMLLEARSSLKSYAIEAANELKEKPNGNSNSIETESKVNANIAGTSSNREINGNLTEKAKNIARHQGPLTVHCSPGTGRTGTIIACDMAIRSLETIKSLDVPQIVYDIRRGRASAVQTKDQYEFIYKVANVYAMKITNVSNDN